MPSASSRPGSCDAERHAASEVEGVPPLAVRLVVLEPNERQGPDVDLLAGPVGPAN